jgi:predicted DCC family thiol-disulfide oxidoreductase YuxK
VDPFGFVHYVSFRDAGVAEVYDLDPERLRRRIHAASGDGRLREGMDALTAIAARSMLLWPALPLLVLVRVVAGQRAYDAVARRRPLVTLGSCGGHCATAQQPPVHRRI